MKIFIEALFAALIGIVEGITEWLPVSSTGHMILLDEILGLKNSVSQDFYDFFLVAIQLGAILAVVVLFFRKLNPFARGKTALEKKNTWRLWLYVIIGILPAAIIGIPLDDFMEEHFYGFPVVALALIVYGVAFILIERKRKDKPNAVEDVAELTPKHALLIGLFQVLSLIPGTSRSGSTILGGMLVGISRTAAAEFSFFMSIPVMLGASLLRGLKFFADAPVISLNEWVILLVGTVVAFFVSLLAIRFLMDFVKKHSFEVFGWYRIALGIIVLIVAACLGKLTFA
ncbi:MAG: undecaprenyl-diphosphate phosphatase [Clostridia bacterium]|nr:undecaprenyl-diphosphate phosphatase [Clostridia bacterium]